MLCLSTFSTINNQMYGRNKPKVYNWCSMFFRQSNIIQYHKTSGPVGLIFEAEIFVFYFCISLGVLMMNQKMCGGNLTYNQSSVI